MIPYTKYTYITPPRAEAKVPRTALEFYEKKNWVAQCKKNGTNSVIFVPPNRELFAKTRHNDDHKMWSFTKGSAKVFRNLPGKDWFVINAELMHSKGNGFRDINYIHDILVADGDYLVMSSYQDRYEKLMSLFWKKNLEETHSHWILNDHTWLAKNIEKDFVKVFDSLDNPEDEGLVLKDPKGLLMPKGNTWAVKCRKVHENYGF